MKKIDVIVGARPNFIKAFPVIKAFNSSNNLKLRLINTGQHYDKNMSDVFFNQLNVKKPDINLNIGSGSHAYQTAKIMIAIEKVFLENGTDLIIVFGDINSTLACALVASKMDIYICHVESGLRSNDMTMPEEINRILTDQISDLLFTTSIDAKKNLIREGIKENKIQFVGNTMIDSLVAFEPYFNSEKILREHNLKKKNFVLVTMHRPAAVDNQNKLKELLKGLNRLSKEIPIIWPIHPRTKNNILKLENSLYEKLNLIDPIGYLEFMDIQKKSKFILTDSGGVQEESTYFNVPCFTLRDNTERPITVKHGSNKLLGTDFNNIEFETLHNLIDNNKNITMPQKWDGKSSIRVVKTISRFLK